MSNLHRLKAVFNDPNRKPTFQMVREVVGLGLSGRGLPGYYFTRLAYQQGSADVHAYLSTQDIIAIHAHFGSECESIKTFFFNKLIFENRMRLHGFPMPETVGITFGTMIYGEQVHSVPDAGALLQVLNGIGFPLFLKPNDGQNGLACHLLTRATSEQDLVEIHAALGSSNYLIQRPIDQHDIISRVYPHSINTLRIDTYKDNGGRVSTISALLRLGVRRRTVDNGGIFVGIDNNGQLKKEAISFLENGASRSQRHPDTHCSFYGLQVPFFDEALDLVKKAAGVVPLRLVGWDIAITPSGPLLIEGNHNYHLGMSDIAYGGYRSNPVFRRVLSEVGLDTYTE